MPDPPPRNGPLTFVDFPAVKPLKTPRPKVKTSSSQ